MKSNIIIFSSTEDLGLAESLRSKFYHGDYLAELWTDGFFALSKSYIENFSNLKLHYEYAVVLLSDSDRVERRGKTLYVARDNLILELGMCIEAFTLAKTVIVKKDNVTLPSDLEGIQPIEYSLAPSDKLDSVAGMIYSKIRTHIERHAQRDELLSWDELFRNTGRFIHTIRRSESLGGFDFDVLVALNRGGLIVGDLIARELGQNKPIISLFADRRGGYPVFEDTDFIINNAWAISALDNRSIRNILVMDSMTRSGRSINEAKKYLMSKLPDKRIKSAVIYANECLRGTDCMDMIDFHVCYKNLDGRHLSLGRV